MAGMQGNQGTEPIRPPATRSATRYCTNHNWCFRGDNTKPKNKVRRRPDIDTNPPGGPETRTRIARRRLQRHRHLRHRPRSTVYDVLPPAAARIWDDLLYDVTDEATERLLDGAA